MADLISMGLIICVLSMIENKKIIGSSLIKLVNTVISLFLILFHFGTALSLAKLIITSKATVELWTSGLDHSLILPAIITHLFLGVISVILIFSAVSLIYYYDGAPQFLTKVVLIPIPLLAILTYLNASRHQAGTNLGYFGAGLIVPTLIFGSIWLFYRIKKVNNLFRREWKMNGG